MAPEIRLIPELEPWSLQTTRQVPHDESVLDFENLLAELHYP
jgi:hypothetical protein